MPSKSYDTAEHKVTESRQNKVAGRILARARRTADMNQTEFAAAIARRIGLPSLAQASLSGWEIHSRAVPAAALIAAAEVARSHGFDLGEALDAELGPATIPQATRLATALESIADALKGEPADQIRSAAAAIRPVKRR